MKARFRFEKLKVWQASRTLNRHVYDVSRGFPSEEKFGMTSQLRRASVSVSCNIAEGSGRNSDRDFSHYLEMAYGSLMEVASLLYLARDQEYIDEQRLDSALEETNQIAGQTVALNKSLEVKGSKTPFPRTNPQSLDSRP